MEVVQLEDLNREEILELIDLSLQIKDRKWFKELSIMLNNTKKKDEVNLNVDYNDLEDNLKDVLNNTDIGTKDYDLEEYELDFDWNGKDVGFLIDGKITDTPKNRLVMENLLHDGLFYYLKS